VSFLDANLEVLSRRQPDLARILAELPPGPVEVFTSVSGVPSARWVSQSATLLHSRYDPLKESRDTLARQDLTGDDCFVLLGFGLGYLLDALLERKGSDDCGYFIVESSLHVLRAAFEARDQRKNLSQSQVHFAWPPSGPELRDQWLRFFDPVKAEKCTFLTHPPAMALAPGLFKSAAEVIQSGTFQVLTDINTLVGRSHEFLRNFTRNFRNAWRSPGVAGLAGRFAGVPAVIVSAGPSLDRNIHELRGREEHVLILATDTALKPLLASGIEPHFVLTADPGYRNYLHLKDVVTHRCLLVIECTAHPDAFSVFPGRTLACTFQDSSLGVIAGMLAHKGSLKAWGSVATMALDFALLLGCDPVVFTGQDLSYSGGRSYCSGVYTESEWFASVSSPEEWAKRWETLKQGHKIVLTQDIFGNPVETTDKLAAYWNWMVKEIESHPGTRFINATEGGILRQGVEVASLRDVLHRFGSPTRDLRDQVDQVSTAGVSGRSSAGHSLIERLEEESRELARILEKGMAVARHAEGETPAALFARLDQIKDSTYRKAPELASLLDGFNQVGNVAFLRSRNRLARTQSPTVEGIRTAYVEYFSAVRAALDAVLPSLAELRREACGLSTEQASA
jgi:hypothetical protein